MRNFNPNKKEFSGDGCDENRVKGREREYDMSLSQSQKGRRRLFRLSLGF